MSYNLKDFESDFVFLLEIKSYLKEYLSKDESQIDEDVLKRGFHSKLRDGRPIRIVIPHGFKQLKDISIDNHLYFVGFIGYAKPSHQIPDNLADKIWKIDYKLIDEFSRHKDILAYVSAERTDGKDWGNLVLLKSTVAVEKWRDCSIHQEAITEISACYYRKIRIHRGIVQHGETKPNRTLFIDYTSTPAIRTEKIWT